MRRSSRRTRHSSAIKWQAGITAFLGVYVTHWFRDRSDDSGVPVSGSIRGVIPAALDLAGAIRTHAVLLALGVAAGLPNAVNGLPLTGPYFYEQLKKLAIREGKFLHWANWWQQLQLLSQFYLRLSFCGQE